MGRLTQSCFPKTLVIRELTKRCADSDKTTRKFACFALGNAGFHSDFLYPQLRGAVKPLVLLLGDEGTGLVLSQIRSLCVLPLTRP